MADNNKSWSFDNKNHTQLFDLTGTVAIVTGGSRGIGRGMALALAQAGASVVIASRAVDKMKEVVDVIKSYGQDAIYISCDVQSKEDLKKLIDETNKKFGRLDVLVPNAGISAGGPAEELSHENFDKVMDVNFNSVFYLCQYAYPLLKANGGGKILTIGSEYSLHGSMRGINYASAKHAIVGLTKSLAVSWAKDKIQVNCVIPGWIHSDLAGPAIDHPVIGGAIKAKTPDPRGYGFPEDMAGLTIFLASKSSDFITGQSIAVDGGFSVSMAPRAGL